MDYQLFQQKDNNISTNYRTFGNDCFSEKKYYEAMLFFNQSLCLAKKGSLNEYIAYAARSKVYYQIGEYELCLQNSQMSKAYRNRDTQTFDEREQECQMKMAELPHEDHDFFKLSHEPNEKIPFLAACLQIREDEKYGRHIITEKELKVGDIIALEPHFNACQKLPENFNRCYNCYKTNMMHLIPCSHCAEVMYCSEKCEEELRILHHFEVDILGRYKAEYMLFLRIFSKAMKACNNSVSELKTLLESNPGKFSEFDFDLSNPEDPSYEKNRLLAFKSMIPEVINPTAINTVWMSFFDCYKEKFFEAWNIKAEHYEFVHSVMSEFFLIFSANTHLMSWYSTPLGFKRLYDDIPQRNSFATGAFPFTSLISHSCAPNCDTISVKGNLLMLYVTQPIKEGEQIFISYGKSYTVTSLLDRQIALKNEYGFDCTCVACENKYPVILDQKHRKFRLPNRNLMDSIAAARNEFKRNNEYIQKNFEANFPCLEIDDLTERNVYNLACIASECMRFKVVID